MTYLTAGLSAGARHRRMHGTGRKRRGRGRATAPHARARRWPRTDTARKADAAGKTGLNRTLSEIFVRAVFRRFRIAFRNL